MSTIQELASRIEDLATKLESSNRQTSQLKHNYNQLLARVNKLEQQKPPVDRLQKDFIVLQSKLRQLEKVPSPTLTKR